MSYFISSSCLALFIHRGYPFLAGKFFWAVFKKRQMSVDALFELLSELFLMPHLDKGSGKSYRGTSGLLFRLTPPLNHTTSSMSCRNASSSRKPFLTDSPIWYPLSLKTCLSYGLSCQVHPLIYFRNIEHLLYAKCDGEHWGCRAGSGVSLSWNHLEWVQQ